MFYEGAATAYYSYKKIERRGSCMNPVINNDGTLQPPIGAEKYTLAFRILSKQPMTEKELVNFILMIFIIIGISLLVIALFDTLI